MHFDWSSEAMALVNQIVAWAREDRFFLANGMPPRMHTRIPYTIKSDKDWFLQIDIRNEESYFVELNSMLQQVSGAYILFHQYDSGDVDDFVGRAIETICALVGQSPRVKEVAEWLYERRTLSMEWAECFDQLCTTISNHLGGTIHARALTASTRYVPTEAIFELYEHGLFPFAWDWETLWCLDPTDLRTT